MALSSWSLAPTSQEWFSLSRLPLGKLALALAKVLAMSSMVMPRRLTASGMASTRTAGGQGAAADSDFANTGDLGNFLGQHGGGRIV